MIARFVGGPWDGQQEELADRPAFVVKTGEPTPAVDDFDDDKAGEVYLYQDVGDASRRRRPVRGRRPAPGSGSPDRPVAWPPKARLRHRRADRRGGRARPGGAPAAAAREAVPAARPAVFLGIGVVIGTWSRPRRRSPAMSCRSSARWRCRDPGGRRPAVRLRRVPARPGAGARARGRRHPDLVRGDRRPRPRVAELSWPAALILGAVLAPTDPAAVFSALAGQSHRIGGSGAFWMARRASTTVAIALASGWSTSPCGERASAVEHRAAMILEGVSASRRRRGGAGADARARPSAADSGGAGARDLAGAAIAFGGAVRLHGSGFVAVYLFGLVAGDRAVPDRDDVNALHSELAHLGEVRDVHPLGAAVVSVDLGSVALDGLVRPSRSWSCCARSSPSDTDFRLHARRGRPSGRWPGCAARFRSCSRACRWRPASARAAPSSR